MMAYLLGYEPLVGQIILDCGFAFSQYILLRAGLFAVAPPAFGLVGAYTAAILTQRVGLAAPFGLLAATCAGGLLGVAISLPLARLRGVFQAIATLALVQIAVSLALFAEPLTGGAMGMNGIPRTVTDIHLVVFLAGMLYLLVSIGNSSIGRAFDAARQDEAVAESLGIRVARYHVLAFALAGVVGALTGALYACHNYSIVPEQFGFSMLVAALAAVVLGGRVSVLGPVVGATILGLLPELSRFLADQRYLLHGALLMLSIIYLPDGIVDTIRTKLMHKRITQPRVHSGAGADVTPA